MDIEIIKRLKKKDRSAQLELIEAYHDYVYTIARRMLKTDAIIEETVQDVFIKIFKKIDSFKERSKLSTWIYTIAYRTCLNALASGKWKQKVVNVDGTSEENVLVNFSDGAENETATASDLKNIIWASIDRLKQPQGVIITLYYLQSFSVEEIAAMMEISANTVKTHLFRGRKRLKSILLQVYEIEDLL